MRRVLLAAALLLFAAAPATAQWLRVDSPNFIVFGEVGDRRTREYTAEFERFREALRRIVPGAATRAAVPTMVFIFRDQRTFGPYRPLFNGKPIELSGYFSSSSSLNVIMLAATDREAALRTIFHEYSHLVLSNVTRDLPTWLDEGLAEYYSTFEVRADGRSAVLGRIIPEHLAALRQERLLPLEELLAVQADSPLYNEGARRSTFYAQSWALVHMLLNGEPARTKEFDEYVRLVTGGRSPVDAWRDVFARQKTLDDLRRYVDKSTMRGYGFTFDRGIAPAAFQVSTPAAADIQAALGDLRREITPERAAMHMTTVNPATPYVQAVRGLLKLDEGKHAEALSLLVEASRTSSDWLVLYRAVTGLERLATGSDDELANTAAAAAIAALDRVLAAKPELPHAIALKGTILGAGDEGLAALARARELAPGHAYYGIWQAQFHVDRREYAAARSLLAPLMSPRFPAGVRDYARSVMAQAVTSEQEARGAQDRTTPPADAPSRRGEMHWMFREVQPGEQRIEGLLDRIECPRTGVILHVRQDGAKRRFAAATFDDMQLLTYREDLGAGVQCGVRTPPDRVYVTFVAHADKAMDGRIVAVEFLPKQP